MPQNGYTRSRHLQESVGAAAATRGGRKDFRRKKAISSLCVLYTVPAPNGDDDDNNNKRRTIGTVYSTCAQETRENRITGVWEKRG